MKRSLFFKVFFKFQKLKSDFLTFFFRLFYFLLSSQRGMTFDRILHERDKISLQSADISSFSTAHKFWGMNTIFIPLQRDEYDIHPSQEGWIRYSSLPREGWTMIFSIAKKLNICRSSLFWCVIHHHHHHPYERK